MTDFSLDAILSSWLGVKLIHESLFPKEKKVGFEQKKNGAIYGTGK